MLLSATPVGHGSTAVSSGILSLTGEDSFSCLVEKIGAERALDAISLMEEAIGNIEKLCGECDGQGIPGGNCGFRRLDCLRYTVSESAEGRIRQEYSLQLHNGFVAELLSPITASSQFTFPMAAGVYTKGAAGQVDPYRLVHAVILLAKQKGAQIYENTAVTAIRPETAEGEYAAMELDCATGHQVKANYVIVAAGLEAGRHCGGLEQPRTTYMVATEPVEDFAGWRGPCVIHREGEPRLYLSVTADNRILIGGLDSALMDEKGRLRLEDAGLIAYSHGSYVALQHKELGTFGYSVMKPKTRRRIAAQKRQDNHARKAKQGDREGKNGKRPEAPVRGQASRRNSSGRKKSHSPAKKIR